MQSDSLAHDHYHQTVTYNFPDAYRHNNKTLYRALMSVNAFLTNIQVSFTCDLWVTYLKH